MGAGRRSEAVPAGDGGMRLDLVASELLVLLQERWPYGGHGQLQAEMYVEDALRCVAAAERQRCEGLIQAKILMLERANNSFSKNAANQLKAVLKELSRDEWEITSSLVPYEEVDE